MAFALLAILLVLTVEGERHRALSVASGLDACPIPDLSTGLAIDISIASPVARPEIRWFSAGMRSFCSGARVALGGAAAYRHGPFFTPLGLAEYGFPYLLLGQHIRSERCLSLGMDTC